MPTPTGQLDPQWRGFPGDFQAVSMDGSLTSTPMFTEHSHRLGVGENYGYPWGGEGRCCILISKDHRTVLRREGPVVVTWGRGFHTEGLSPQGHCCIDGGLRLLGWLVDLFSPLGQVDLHYMKKPLRSICLNFLTPVPALNSLASLNKRLGFVVVV